MPVNIWLYNYHSYSHMWYWIMFFFLGPKNNGNSCIPSMYLMGLTNIIIVLNHQLLTNLTTTHFFPSMKTWIVFYRNSFFGNGIFKMSDVFYQVSEFIRAWCKIKVLPHLWQGQSCKHTIYILIDMGSILNLHNENEITWRVADFIITLHLLWLWRLRLIQVRGLVRVGQWVQLYPSIFSENMS